MGQLGQELTDPTELDPERNPQLPTVRGDDLGPVALCGHRGWPRREIGPQLNGDKQSNRPALPFGWGRNGLDWWL